MCLASPDIKVLLHRGSVSSCLPSCYHQYRVLGGDVGKRKRIPISKSPCALCGSNPMFYAARKKRHHKPGGSECLLLFGIIFYQAGFRNLYFYNL